MYVENLPEIEIDTENLTYWELCLKIENQIKYQINSHFSDYFWFLIHEDLSNVMDEKASGFMFYTYLENFLKYQFNIILN